MIQLGAMPLPSFLKLHPDDRVTAEELATLKAYLAPWTAAPSQPGNVPTAVAPGASAPVSLASASLTTVQPELNGFAFDPSFENWKPISTADRGDNNTFRFILGNDVAVKAAQSGNICRMAHALPRSRGSKNSGLTGSPTPASLCRWN